MSLDAGQYSLTKFVVVCRCARSILHKTLSSSCSTNLRVYEEFTDLQRIYWFIKNSRVYWEFKSLLRILGFTKDLTIFEVFDEKFKYGHFVMIYDHACTIHDNARITKVRFMITHARSCTNNHSRPGHRTIENPLICKARTIHDHAGPFPIPCVSVTPLLE